MVTHLMSLKHCYQGEKLAVCINCPRLKNMLETKQLSVKNSYKCNLG